MFLWYLLLCTFKNFSFPSQVQKGNTVLFWYHFYINIANLYLRTGGKTLAKEKMQNLFLH